MDGSWVNLGLILLCIAWVFGYQENGSEHRSVCMLCLVCKKMKENNRKRGFSPPVGVLLGKVVEVRDCVVFVWQESERKGEKIIGD